MNPGSADSRDRPAIPDIRERIGGLILELSPQERRAAAYLQDHLEEAAGYTSTELAELAGVSKATVSRLFRSLGFETFREAKVQLRAVRPGAPRPVAPGSGPETHFRVEAHNLQRAAAALSAAALATAAHRIRTARRVAVVGLRNGYPIALHLREQLVQLRSGVVTLPAPGQSLGEEIADLDASDLAILVAVPRRSAALFRLIAALRRRSVPMIALGDASARPALADAVAFFETPVQSAGAFSSYATAMSTACLLANAVAVDEGAPEMRRRVELIDGAYAELDELEDEGRGRSNPASSPR
jgi:DNA-binding MurR/RpiR family transcriptional regulator